MSVCVESLSDQVVSERDDPRLDLPEHTAVENLAHPGIAADRRKNVEVHNDSDDSGSLEGGSSLDRQPLDPQPDRVTKRFWDRHARPCLEFETARSGSEPTRCLQCTRQLLHEERHPLGAVVQRGAKRGPRLAFENPCRQPTRRFIVERLKAEFGQPSRAAEVDA